MSEKSTPTVEAVRLSKRTGNPVRKYTKTGAAAKARELLAQGISPRTGKPLRKYNKTGAAATARELLAKGISPRTGKPLRKYTKAGTKAGEPKPVSVPSESATANVASPSTSSSEPSVKKATKIVREVIASDEM